MRRVGGPAISSAGTVIVILLVALAALAVVAVGNSRQTAQNLPAINQPPTIRTIRETWFLSPSAHQDRFDPSEIVVNQGDTVRLTLIDNDTVAHDLVIGQPYNIIINATVPGLVNDLTHQVFTTNATNNSPGVLVKGTPGNVSAYYSFVAQYAGIYEFVCTYHAQVGMIGYLVVLPNEAFKETVTTTSTSSGISGGAVVVLIIPGASNPASAPGFSPADITLVLGVNSTVVWNNHDSIDHTVTSDSGLFDSGDLPAGANFTWQFTSAGVYHYHCTYHPTMTGKIVVKVKA